MVNYPAQIDNSLSIPASVDNNTPVTASVTNRLREAIIAIESELGVKPGGMSTVRARFESINLTLENLDPVMLGGDIGGTTSFPLIIGLQGYPISDTAPAADDVLTWNGLAWVPGASGGGGGSVPGGFDGFVQFNDLGSFGGDTGFTYNKTTNVLNLSDALAIGTTPATIGDIRLSNLGTIYARNAANSADVVLVNQDVSNIARFGDLTNTTQSRLQAATDSGIIVNGGGNYLVVDATKTSTIGALSISVTPATTGTIRLPIEGMIVSRNTANTADNILIGSTGAGDELAVWGTGVTYGHSRFHIGSSANMFMSTATIDTLILNGTNATFGVPVVVTAAAGSVSIGGTPATTGTIRLANAGSVYARNAANSADSLLINNDVSDQLTIGDSNLTNVTINGGAGYAVYHKLGGSDRFTIGWAAVYLGVPLIGLSGFPYALNGVGTQAMADANQTVASAIYCFNTIVTTGAITANRNLTLPVAADADAYTKIIDNRCTGLFSVIVTAGVGTTVTITNNSIVTVLIDSRGVTQVGIDGTLLLSNNVEASMEVLATTTTQSGNANGRVKDVIRSLHTTNATVTNIYTWTIQTGAVTTVDALITAIADDGTVGASYKRTVTFRESAGVNLIGTLHDNQTDEDAGAWDVTINDDGAGGGRIRVTGDAVLGVTWYLSGRVQHVILTP